MKKRKIFKRFGLGFLMLGMFLTMGVNIKAATVEVTSITDLETKFAAATEDTTFTLGSSFPTTLTEMIDLTTSYAGVLTIDGANIELMSADNQRHFHVTDSTGTTEFINLNLMGKIVLDADGRPTNAGVTGAAGGITINNNSNVNVSDSQFSNLSSYEGAAIRALYGSSLKVDNSVFKNGLAGGGGGAIDASNNGVRNLIINNSSFINNLANIYGGFDGGAIAAKYVADEITISNSYFEGNATKTSGTGGGGGGAFSYEASSSWEATNGGSNLKFIDNYFVNNRAVLDPTTTDTGDAGAIYIFNVGKTASLLIDGNTFEGNIASDDGGAIMFQNQAVRTTDVTNYKIINSTFYGNQALGRESGNAGVSGGAIQIFANQLLGEAVLDIQQSTFIDNSSVGNNQKGGAIAGSGYVLGNGVVNSTANLFLDNKIIGADNAVIASNNSNLSVGSASTNTESIGYDNGTASTATDASIMGGFEPLLSTNSSAVKVGSSLDQVYTIPTVMIVPNTGTTGLADNVITPTNSLSVDERNFNRSTVTADAGAVEIGFIKYNENGGTWTLPQLTSYDGKTYYEGTNPDDVYAVGYLNESANVRNDAGLTRDGYTFLGWDANPNATVPTYTAGDTVTVNESQTLYAIWEETKVEEHQVTYDGNNHSGGTSPVDNNKYVTGDSATILDEGNLVKDGHIFKGWHTDPNATTAKHQPGDKINITGSVILYAIWEKIETPTDNTKPDTSKPEDIIDDEIQTIKSVPNTGSQAMVIVFAVVGLAGVTIAIKLNHKRREV